MKKVVGAVIVLIAVAAFFAGGHYRKGQSAGMGSQAEQVHAGAIETQENTEVSQSPGAVKISPYRQQLMGVKVVAVEEKPMTYTLRLYGRVVADETKVYRVNASTDSWIRELSDVTTGSIVGKNQILAEALAPAYFNAQATYLIALDNVDRINRQMSGQLRHQQTDLADRQIRVAVQTLQNLGITDAQTEELANKRQARPYLQVRSPSQGVVLSRNITLKQWFKAGEAFYTIADIGKVWVYADVYEDEAMHMRPGMAVEVKHARMGQIFSASVGEVLPLFDPASRTLKVRVDVDNPRYDLRPDMFVDVEIPITMPPSLHVPADAILDTGTKTMVYVDAGNGTFEPRRVKTGWRLGRQIEITGGLRPGEKVAVSGNFLIDSESKMEIASLGATARMGEDPVCGRNVDEEEAELFERAAAYANKTLYFCSDLCKKEFEKEPEKYVRKERTDGEKQARAVMPGLDRSWADLLNPVKGGQGIGDGTESGREANDTLSKSASSTGIVDWDGPEKKGAPPRDWSGWGAFPGAEYLGLKHRYKPKKTSSESSGLSKAAGEKTDKEGQGNAEASPEPNARGAEMNNENQEKPASDQPQSSGK